MTFGSLTDRALFVIIPGHRRRGRLPAGSLAVRTVVRTRGQPRSNRCSDLKVQLIYTVRPRSKATVFHLSSLPLLLLPPCHPQIMSVLSERPTILADPSKHSLTPSADSSIAIPHVVVNGKKQNTSASLPHQRPKSSSSNRSAGANDEWGSNFWVTLVDPQVSISPWLELNANTESDQTSPA